MREVFRSRQELEAPGLRPRGGGPAHRPGIGPPPGWAGRIGESEINLVDYLRLVWAKRWLILTVTAATVVIASAWTLTRKNVFRTDAALSIDVRAPEITRGKLAMGRSFWDQERYFKEQERVLRSYDLAQQVVDRLGIEAHPELHGRLPAPTQLLGMIDIQSEPEAGILNLFMTGGDPARITEWLNIYVEEFIRFNIEESLLRTQQVYEVIQSKLEPLLGQLKDSEVRLTDFKGRRDSLLSADQDKNVISEQVNTLTTEFATAKAERIRLETKLYALQNLRAENLPAATSPEVLNDPTIHSLRQQLNSLNVELREGLSTYREGHPAIKDLRRKIAGVKEQINEQVDTILAALGTNLSSMRQREQTLYESLQQLRDETIELSKQEMEYESLRRDYEQNKSFYEEMLARSKEAEISGTVSFNRIRVIDKARVPNRPVSPNVPRSISMSMVVGLFFGVGLVFFLDYLDRTLRTPDDVERHLGHEVFSVVPIYKDVKKRALLEVYQGLRTALIFAAREEVCQVVLITSAGPGEGKTTTTLNLGKVLAAAGSRVLVLDSDLRKPGVHRTLGIDREHGLTSVALGDKQLSEVIHTFEDYPNLHVVPSGPLPPNPPELFGKTSFKNLLKVARSSYDWVLIDSPPVVSVTDAVVCSNLAEMVLLVVEYGRLDRKVIQGAKRQLDRAGARIVGVVLNRVDLERKHYYYDSHYYSYHYGYSEDGEAPAAQAGSKE